MRGGVGISAKRVAPSAKAFRRRDALAQSGGYISIKVRSFQRVCIGAIFWWLRSTELRYLFAFCNQAVVSLLKHVAAQEICANNCVAAHKSSIHRARRIALNDLALGIGVVIATLVGPVLAVLVTRHIDDRRHVRERREDVFRSLMVGRRAALSTDNVRALNLVEIEFYGIRPVEVAHREVMMHINSPRPFPDGWVDRNSKLQTKLLSEIAKVLGYELQQLDVLDGGYYPQGFVDIELEQQSVRRAFIEVLSGRRPLTVAQAAPTPPSPFPPPPAPSTQPGGKE